MWRWIVKIKYTNTKTFNKNKPLIKINHLIIIILSKKLYLAKRLLEKKNSCHVFYWDFNSNIFF